MIVLGISETHCATAAILRDAVVGGCASEERFTRLKNHAGYPRLAIGAPARAGAAAPADRPRGAGGPMVNLKGLASPYMMLAFATNPKRREEIVAAVPPPAGPARAHVVDEACDRGHHRVIHEFERRTGIGAVLNTSFNLHGEPLVGSPADAVDIFERSGLPHLALGRFLISKR